MECRRWGLAHANHLLSPSCTILVGPHKQAQKGRRREKCHFLGEGVLFLSLCSFREKFGCRWGLPAGPFCRVQVTRRPCSSSGRDGAIFSQSSLQVSIWSCATQPTPGVRPHRVQPPQPGREHHALLSCTDSCKPCFSTSIWRAGLKELSWASTGQWWWLTSPQAAGVSVVHWALHHFDRRWFHTGRPKRQELCSFLGESSQ